jgi:Ca2+-binding RTX toxin-like protein
MAVINGTNGNDILSGTAGNDIMRGYLGNDRLIGKEGSNYLDGGDGNNFLYGNFNGIISINMAGPPATINITPATPRPLYSNYFQATTISYGDNTLISGSGADTLYGSLVDLNLNTAIPDLTLNVNANDKLVSINSVNITNTHFGSNILNSDGGDDAIYGHLNNLGLALMGNYLAVDVTGNKDSIILQNNAKSELIFGDNSIDSGSGNDQIYGNLLDFRFSLINSDTTLNSSGFKNYVSVANDISSRVYFEGNTIDGGSGNDTLHGNLRDFNFAILGGNLNSTTDTSSVKGTFQSDYSMLNFVNFGNNTLVGGTGDDVLLGNLHNFSFAVLGPSVNLEANGQQQTLQITNFIDSIINFCANNLDGGLGNDTLMGNMNNMLYSVIGGTLTAASSAGNTINMSNMLTSKVCFGSNNLMGGGGNDTMYGNMHQLELSTLNGTVDTTGMFASNFTVKNTTANYIYFGDNFLHAAGVSTLYGNMQSLIFDTGDGNAHIIFGNNTLQGLGTLIASVNSYEMNSSNVTTFTSDGKIGIKDTMGNSILWGNNTLTGGDSADTFVFAVANTNANQTVMQGHNIITNFNNASGVLGDTLNIGQYTSGGNLDSHVVITHSLNANGLTDTTLNFDGGGSIKLLGINIASLTDIHHLQIS